nr:hypothetical protein [uncultured Desulfobulbus sp.]
MKQTIADLSDYLPEIYSSIIAGFDDAIKYAKTSPKVLDKTTVSNIVSRFVRYEAKQRFPGYFIQNSSRLAVLAIGDKLIKLKKLDRQLFAGNIATKQADQFVEQRVLPGFEPSTHLHAGWVTDPTGLKIEAVYLTQPAAQRLNHWVFSISEFIENGMIMPQPPIIEAMAQTVDLPVQKPTVKDGARVRRIRKTGSL